MMDCGESGSTLRFMLPVTAVRGVPAAFTGRGKLAERPLSPLYEEMTRHGAVLSPQGRFPLTVDGRLKAGEYLLAGNVSSQFISGLMMALPQAEEDSRIVIGGRLESRPYVELTAETLKMFGIRTETEETASRTPKNATAEQDRSGEPFRQEETVIRIPGRQLFRSPGRVTVEGDWSGAAFWLAAGALSEAGVTCAHVNPGSAQGDRAIAALLRRFGADVTETADSVTVRRGELLGCGIDAADIPDLVPILGVAAAYARGETRIRNIRRLRMKESDRVASVLAMIRSLGGQGEASENEMIIYGSEGLRGGTVDAFRDHRIAMAAAIAATGAEKPVTILGAEAVNKSYPGFFEEFERLGGGVRR